MCLPCAPPPPTSPYIQSTRLGVWASVLTCREQHSSGYYSSSMLIVASWEEINKAIKGDITVCLGPHAHTPPNPFSPPFPSVGPVYEGFAGWWEQLKKVSSMRFWSKDEMPSLGVWGKTVEWDPWLICRRSGSFRGLMAAVCCQGSKALVPVKAHRCRLLTIRRESQEVKRGLAKLLMNRGRY